MLRLCRQEVHSEIILKNRSLAAPVVRDPKAVGLSLGLPQSGKQKGEAQRSSRNHCYKLSEIMDRFHDSYKI